MTSRRLFASLLGLILLVSAPALAADNYTIQSGGQQRNLRAKEINGVLHNMSIPMGSDGIPYSSSAGLPVAQQGTLPLRNWYGAYQSR